MTIGDEKVVALSERLRPDVECAPWVIVEVRKIESAYAELAASVVHWRMKHEAAESQLADLRVTLQGIADADYREWDDGFNTPLAFVDWAKSRAAHALRTLAAADGG